MRILCLVPGGIGDQLLFFPTLETLKQQYPQSSIDVIVEPRAKVAYRICKFVHEVLIFDFKDRNGLADYLNLLGIIKDREYDMAITLGQRWTVGFLLWLNGIPTRVGYQSKSSWFINYPAPLNTDQYAASMYHDLLKGLNINTPCPPIQIKLTETDLKWAIAEQKDLNVKENEYLLIHGGSSQLAKLKGIDKIYPVEKWQQVLTQIQEQRPELPIVVIQGPEDQEFITQLKAVSPSLKVIEPLDLAKLGAFIAGAKLMLCTDSGPMHLSVGVGTKTIALFGPTEVKKLLPSNQNQYIGIQSPTGKIGDIEPEKIAEQVISV
jgi:ADP-heptose:LPS heptosyltransferase